MLFSKLHRALQAAEAVYSHHAGDGGPTTTQLLVLQAMAAWPKKGPQPSQTALVHACNVDRSTMADLIRRLVTKGLMKRMRNPKDTRAYILTLTEDGRRAAAAGTAAQKMAERDLCLSLNDKDRKDLMVLLDALRAPAPARAAA